MNWKWGQRNLSNWPTNFRKLSRQFLWTDTGTTRLQTRRSPGRRPGLMAPSNHRPPKSTGLWAHRISSSGSDCTSNPKNNSSRRHFPNGGNCNNPVAENSSKCSLQNGRIPTFNAVQDSRGRSQSRARSAWVSCWSAICTNTDKSFNVNPPDAMLQKVAVRRNPSFPLRIVLHISDPDGG